MQFVRDSSRKRFNALELAHYHKLPGEKCSQFYRLQSGEILQLSDACNPIDLEPHA